MGWSPSRRRVAIISSRGLGSSFSHNRSSNAAAAPAGASGST